MADCYRPASPLSPSTGRGIGLDSGPMALDPRIQRLHDAACARGDAGYIDPATGLLVLTEAYLRARGECCWSGCRHCPWEPRHQGPRKPTASRQ